MMSLLVKDISAQKFQKLVLPNWTLEIHIMVPNLWDVPVTWTFEQWPKCFNPPCDDISSCFLVVWRCIKIITNHSCHIYCNCLFQVNLETSSDLSIMYSPKKSEPGNLKKIFLEDDRFNLGMACFMCLNAWISEGGVHQYGTWNSQHESTARLWASTVDRRLTGDVQIISKSQLLTRHSFANQWVSLKYINISYYSVYIYISFKISHEFTRCVKTHPNSLRGRKIWVSEPPEFWVPQTHPRLKISQPTRPLERVIQHDDESLFWMLMRVL